MSLITKLSRQVANSPKGKELLEKAERFANDPKTREKLDDARGKINEGIGAAKHKLAERRGTAADADDGPSGTATPTTHPSNDEPPKAA